MSKVVFEFRLLWSIISGHLAKSRKMQNRLRRKHETPFTKLKYKKLSETLNIHLHIWIFHINLAREKKTFKTINADSDEQTHEKD